ncbi:sensor histidine kinase [Prosthecobacter vanneervenii]|uniref:histidine kinase n=1 Tax=Prosthecobacter vanneervenii TaxID=48466 RepID=A0A7W7YG50_9BACT|nr:HAMP domain-containing sensor histidine kinase [Prosthecobacter vanneervenii]MBB5035235.1 signal transduction histidine kinase [Prosthecobacter vanneervenii]
MIFTRSIRWRIQAWHALLLTIVIAGFGITAHRLVSMQKLREVDLQLQAQVAQLGIAFPPVPARDHHARPPPRPGISVTDQITASGTYYIVWNADGSEQARSPNAPAALRHPSADQEGGSTVGGDRHAVHFTGAGRCFLAGRRITAELDAQRQLAWYLLVAGGGVLALGLAGGGWLAARAIRPIQVISETAEKIATGTLSQRIPPVSDDELGRLAAVLNATFSRLEAAFAHQARFTADAAHELRTPVAAVLMHAENGLAAEPLTEEQREAFAACRRASQRMKQLIGALLELSRLDAGQEPMRQEPCGLDQIAQDCLDLVETLAQARHITLAHELKPAPCRGDAGRLGQVVINLLSNAIAHARSSIRICTRCEMGRAILSVHDDGPGVAQEHLAHLFDRFYRADASRTDAEHHGLGLAISKAIIDAHGGEISVANNDEGHGAIFTIALRAAE